ncbi:LysR family transcriptional regulator [Herbaspirillum autotrophicum]|uniref:LysR family transcriptional regulator n=1 Tax=Herbaspirillum autotrophicum TaxID=180195 RepID=UPI000A67A780|nr:LysR family transcriptional regulator [Herbaspirillum autotrophicum]
MPNANHVDIQMLQIFVTTAEEQNMTNAAKRLGITQSAVSQSIQQLEEQFGVQLMNRTRRPLSLTSAGLALKNRALTLLGDIANLKAQIIDASQGIKPDVRIGLVDSFAATCGVSFIKEMLNVSATLSIRAGLSPMHGESLIGRSLDLAISTDGLHAIDGIVRRRLLSERFVLITPKSYPGTYTTISDMRKLADTQPLLHFNRQSHLGAQIDVFLRRIDIKVPHRLELDGADTLTSMVAGGIGWAITTPMCLLQSGTSIKTVKVHPLKGANAGRSLFLLARYDEYKHLFNQTYRIAHAILESTLPPGLRSIHPGLESLIELEPRTDHEQDDIDTH